MPPKRCPGEDERVAAYIIKVSRQRDDARRTEGVSVPGSSQYRPSICPHDLPTRATCTRQAKHDLSTNKHKMRATVVRGIAWVYVWRGRMKQPGAMHR